MTIKEKWWLAEPLQCCHDFRGPAACIKRRMCARGAVEGEGTSSQG